MNAQSLSPAALQDKNVQVNKLMQKLEDALSTQDIAEQTQVDILSQLKIHGREVRGSDAIYSDHGLEILCKYAFERKAINASREALRIVANALLLQPSFRVKLAGLRHAAALTDIYRQPDDNDEFLGGRILFLLTYGTDTDFEDLVDSHHLVEAIDAHVQRHGERLAENHAKSSDIGDMALSETLKLLFNLANAIPDKLSQLSSTASSIYQLLRYTDLPPLPLDPPLSTVINALAILDLSPTNDSSSEARREEQYPYLTAKLVQILEATVNKYKPAQLDTIAISLITVLRKVNEVLSAVPRKIMQESLLPADSERDLPLGQSSSLASKLLRLTSTPGLTNLPESILALMFELSNKDASTFVKNIGYGYAAGYLMTHKIPIPESAKQTQSGQNANEIPINPITGQRLDKETVPETIDMTDEEKEREAERLFVLFERLKATGVVNVKNPVEEAMEQGRFEEIDD